MLARLDAAFDSQRLFVANASHELRTPLSVIRTELDVTLSDPDASSRRAAPDGRGRRNGATERAQRLVGSLLTLARLQAGVRGELEVRRAGRPGHARAEQRSTAVRGRGGASGNITIEHEVAPARTRRRPAPAGAADRQPASRTRSGTTCPAAGCGSRCGETRRPGLAARGERRRGHPAGRGRLAVRAVPTRRHRRARTATRGAGLGLSIVRLIVDAHHGAAGGGSAVRWPGHPHRAARTGARGRYRDGRGRPPIPGSAGAGPPDRLTVPSGRTLTPALMPLRAAGTVPR